jgi:hypothetical protein
VSFYFRDPSLGNLGERIRRRGCSFDEAGMAESFLVLHAVGGIARKIFSICAMTPG